MTEYSRREFLMRSGLASASLLLPRFLKAFQSDGKAFLPEGNKRLVVIQMSGGNDGLNTVVPCRNDDYYSLRPNIAVPKTDILSLTDDLGLNPSLKSLKDLYGQGFLSIINNVGYPNPDRSHFRSMDIWHSASGSDKFITTGWLGRYLDAQCPDCKSYYAIEADDTLSLAMKGETRKGLAVSNPNLLHADAQRKLFRDVSADYSTASQQDNPLDYLYKTQAETISSADYIYEKFKVYKSSTDYPKGEFGKNLKTIAELIISGMDTKVYYVSIGSFDTHVGQKGRQEKLFAELSDGLASFVKDLQQNNCFKDTLIMTFSEFGRRVKENANNGTDHGTANNMFLIGGALAKPGIYNEPANLVDLDNGDLKYHVDFRSVYATVLNRWLKADDNKILGAQYDHLNLI
ncbi:MAG TPA: DUF1501 domain-containing protein [Bacteroidia bacterium]|jgi:uncharacterized protein (DUF1501 family)|nr:DUF1501 domain-containing protein [Bacteroidia bacterium]